MATYTQGYQPYMPDWQPFTPDYKFLSDVLDVKTNRYNTNYKALNDVYSKVVYSDLSRSDTQNMRNQYAENLGKQLQMISGMDLSIAQNVDAAKQLFKPFYEEDIIVKDLVFTKQYQKEMEYANMLLNSPDPKQKELYWSTGVKALQYQMDDFINASSETALRMGSPRYTPDADLYQKAIDFLKASGLDVTEEYVDEIGIFGKPGFFIVKDRNGNLVTRQAYEMAQRALLDDPTVQQAYYTDAYVKSRDFAQAGMEAGEISSVDEGQAIWAQETIKAIEQNLAARSANEQEEVIKLRNIDINWDEYKNSYGIIPGSDEEKQYIENKASYQTALQSLKRTQETLKNSQGSMDQSTQGLLNRAYNLLMGANIQDDLAAAAVTFSNINRSRELKVNEYKKQELQFQHDYAKMAKQFLYDSLMEDKKQQNRIDLEKEKNRLANPFGNVFSQLFDPQYLTNKSGAIYSVDPDASYFDINNAKIEELRVGVTERQVDLALEALRMLEPNANNQYTIPNSTIEGDLPSIRKQLLDPNNAQIADDFYKKMANQVRDSETLKKTNPNFLAQNNGQTYRDLYDQFENVTSRRLQLDAVVSTGNQIMFDNFMKVLQTDLTKEAQAVRASFENGVPKIFKNLSNGAHDIKSEDEFVDEYVKLAEQKAIKTSDKKNVGWVNITSPHAHYMSGEMRDFGSGAKPFGSGAKEFGSGAKPFGYKGPRRTVNTFNKDEATRQAIKAYQMQKSLIDNTLNGSLETIAEQDASEKKLPYTRMFQPWDPYQYMRGIGLDEMKAGDVNVARYYETQIDPVTATRDANQIDALRNLMTQVRITPEQNLTFIQGDVGEQDEADLLSTDPTAKLLYNLWVQEMARFRDPEASKTDMPSVTLGYASSYGAKEDVENRNRAAYVMTFSSDWLESLKGTDNNPGPLSNVTISDYNTITLSFPKSEDINPRKEGEFNFSAVRNEVMYSPQKQTTRNIDAGGRIRIYPDAKSDLIAEVTALQYNPENDKFEDMSRVVYNLTQQMNSANESIGYIDNLVSSYINRLGKIAQQNNQDRLNNKKVKATK